MSNPARKAATTCPKLVVPAFDASTEVVAGR